jgi:hypothetical protein
MKLGEKRTYIPEMDRLVVETTYDAEPAMKEAEEARAQGGVLVGTKGQQMLKACVIPLEHIARVKQESGYDLLSPDPDQWRNALLYIQTNHQRFMATDKKVFTGKEAKKWV